MKHLKICSPFILQLTVLLLMIFPFPAKSEDSRRGNRCQNLVQNQKNTPDIPPNATLLDTSNADPTLLEIKQDLSQRVVGHPTILDAIIDVLVGIKANIQRRGPAGALLVTGTTGVGKTSMFEILSTLIEGNLIEIEGGNMQDPAQVSGLIGAPVGYVGHGTTFPIITPDFIENARGKRIPVTIVLINELEKAHKDFLNWLLKGLDSGTNKVWIPNGKGTRISAEQKYIDFTKVLFVATSNAGAQTIQTESERIKRYYLSNNPNVLTTANSIGQIVSDLPPNADFQHLLINDLITNFHNMHEFVGRWNVLVAYPILNRGYNLILNNELRRIEQCLLVASGNKIKLNLQLTDKARDFILLQIQDNFGARNLSKLVDQMILSPLSNAYLSNRFSYENNILIDLNTSKLNILNTQKLVFYIID